MNEQLSFGCIAPPVFTDSLFFALMPDAESATRILDLAQHLRSHHRLKGVPTAIERLHVTLVFLGGFTGLPQSVVSSAITAGGKMEAAPFEVAFDRVQKFGHDKRALVLRGGKDVGEPFDFHRRLVELLRYEGLKPVGPSGFTPHMTILYDEMPLAEGLGEPISWSAKEFVLVHSFIGQSRYEILGRWPLE